jgi:hypothetical protein
VVGEVGELVVALGAQGMTTVGYMLTMWPCWIMGALTVGGLVNSITFLR